MWGALSCRKKERKFSLASRYNLGDSFSREGPEHARFFLRFSSPLKRAHKKTSGKNISPSAVRKPALIRTNDPDRVHKKGLMRPDRASAEWQRSLSVWHRSHADGKRKNRTKAAVMPTRRRSQHGQKSQSISGRVFLVVRSASSNRRQLVWRGMG